MKNIKVFIVTYRRVKTLNNTLDRLFNHTDFMSIPNTQVNIINNHSEFSLDSQFENKVNVIHNNTRPDWDTGNLARNWNESLLHGFKDLKNPDADIVTTMQNDIVLGKNWATNLIKMHKKYTFVTGQLGDNIISYKPEAVQKIGMWDERYLTPVNKEADYFIRALIYNKDKSLINDKAHGRLLNVADALELDTSEYQGNDADWRATFKNNENSREGWYHTSQIFYWKWKDTWKTQPSYYGWLTKWSEDFINNPPSPPKAPNFVQYAYFEKDIELRDKNYVGWRKGDYWLDADKCCDIDVHPFKKGQPFRT